MEQTKPISPWIECPHCARNAAWDGIGCVFEECEMWDMDIMDRAPQPKSNQTRRLPMAMTIDMTPTWEGLVGIGLHILQRSVTEEKLKDPDCYDEEGWEYERKELKKAKDVWVEEFTRMAKAADRYNKEMQDRCLDTIEKVNNELTDLAARMEDSIVNEDIPQAQRDAIEEAKWDVESAMGHTDPDNDYEEENDDA